MARKVGRYGFLIFTGLFALGILAQVFFIGLSLLGGRPSWSAHVDTGHSIGGLVLLMVVFGYIGRNPRAVKWQTWLNLVIYILLADVVIFMRGSAPLAAALHPVLAVLLFGNTTLLAVQAVKLLREVREPAAAGLALQPAATAD